MSSTVAILGAGIGGLTTAARLRELLPDDDRIALVDRSFEHVQGLSMLWLLRGWRTLDQVQVTPSTHSLAGIERVTGTVEGIDLADRRVGTSAGAQPYDALVVALGAQVDTTLVPGLDDAMTAGVAAHYYTADAAMTTHQKLRSISSGRVVFLVTGMPYKCPAAPYEGAMLAADLFKETGVRKNVTLDIYTPEPQPMPVAGPVVGQGVIGMLKTADIGFHPGHEVDHIDATSRHITFADGQQVPFDVLVFVPPHRPPGAVAAAGLSQGGWITVDPHTLAASPDDVWALGDVASITLPNGKPLPKAAVFAKTQAAAVAAGVARRLGHDTPDVRFPGEGHCYLETGSHLAARGAGDFYHPDGPKITLTPPSNALHQAKELEETEWLSQWSTIQ